MESSSHFSPSLFTKSLKPELGESPTCFSHLSPSTPPTWDTLYSSYSFSLDDAQTEEISVDSAQQIALAEWMKLQLTETIQQQIECATRYHDDVFEFRWVQLPFKHPFFELDPSDPIRCRTLTEKECKIIGIRQSRGWIHIGYAPNESHILIFRRVKSTQQRSQQSTEKFNTGNSMELLDKKYSKMIHTTSNIEQYLQAQNNMLQTLQNSNIDSSDKSNDNQWNTWWPCLSWEHDSFLPHSGDKNTVESETNLDDASDTSLSLHKIAPFWCARGVHVLVSKKPVCDSHKERIEAYIVSICPYLSAQKNELLVAVKLIKSVKPSEVIVPISSLRPVNLIEDAILFEENQLAMLLDDQFCAEMGRILQADSANQEILFESMDGTPFLVNAATVLKYTNVPM